MIFFWSTVSLDINETVKKAGDNSHPGNTGPGSTNTKIGMTRPQIYKKTNVFCKKRQKISIIHGGCNTEIKSVAVSAAKGMPVPYRVGGRLQTVASRHAEPVGEIINLLAICKLFAAILLYCEEFLRILTLPDGIQ